MSALQAARSAESVAICIDGGGAAAIHIEQP